jgi:hypothetical protein
MQLEELTLGEKIALCQRAELAVGSRLHLFARLVDPEDEPLRQLLLDLASDEARRLVEIERLSAWAGTPAATRLTPEELDHIVLDHFPSLSKSTGEGMIQRESGTYLAQCLQEESVRLYRQLAEHAGDGESRSFFLHWLREGEWDIDFIRNVILT